MIGFCAALSSCARLHRRLCGKRERSLEGASMEKNNLRFEFGRNWSAFLTVLNEERIAVAETSLKRALNVKDLQGKRFLDVGCGSGLFSLAALRLGASVHSFDYDVRSVACAAELKRRYFCNSPHWAIESGSALDPVYLARLGRFDVVYSWGVLHHTGDMWRALENVVPLVNRDGKLFISIYGDMGELTRRWRAIKKLYVSSNRAGQWAILLSVWTFLQIKSSVGRLARLQNPLPFRVWREYRKNRGMSAWHDFVDWVGGYPYEAASVEEIFEFYRDRGFGLEFLRTGGLGCNEFVFNRAESALTARPEMRALPA